MKDLHLKNNGGFTFVEVTMSLAIFTVLMTSALSLTQETMSFVLDNDADVTVQNEGNRAYGRLLGVVKKSGRVTLGGVTYPRVTGGGTRLEFRRLADLDGNGYPFDQATGALEWDPFVYTLTTDSENRLDVYRSGDKVYPLGRFIQNLRFETIQEDPALHLSEIRITYEARKPTGKGFDMVHAVNASVHMRN
jgi:prepilin-type N-terminal cleavage/methylation domain-containing protein